MKHSFLLFCLIFVSQLLFSQGFRGGFTAGVVGSQVEGDRLSGYDQTGFTGGIFVINKINDDWSFSMAIRYIGKGSRKNADPEKGDYTYYWLRLHYVEVPVLAIFHWKKYSPEFGLGYSYLIKGLEDSDAYGSIEPFPPFRKYEFPLFAGISYEAGKHFRINTQISYSILAIRPHPGNQTYYFDRGQHNNVINLTLQYTI